MKPKVVGGRSRTVGGDSARTLDWDTMSRRRCGVGSLAWDGAEVKAEQRPEASAILRRTTHVSHRAWWIEVAIVGLFSSMKAGRMLSQSGSGALGIHIS